MLPQRQYQNAINNQKSRGLSYTRSILKYKNAMARYLKIAALAAAIVLLVLLAAGAYFAATVNPNDYKGDLARLMLHQHGRTLAIPGPIKLRLYPRIGAEFGKVSLSEQYSSAQFASAERVIVSVALLPLLRNQIEIDRVEVRGARMRLLRDESGTINVSGLTAARTAQNEAGGVARGGRSIRFAIDSIRIDNAHLVVDDSKTGRRLEVSHLNIESGAVARGVPGKLALSGNVSMNKPALNMALTFRSQFMPDAGRRRIAFTDLEANLDIASKNARIAAAGRLDVDLDVDEFAADIKGRLDDSVFDLKAGRRAGAFNLALDIDKLDLGRYRDKPVAADPESTSAPSAPDLSAMAGLRASGSMRIGALTMGEVNASDVRAVLRADGVKLALEPTAASLYGGSAAGSLAFDFARSQTTPRITLVQAFKGVQVGPLLRAALGRDTIDGSGDLLLDLNTEGATMAAMRQALGGRAVLRLADGSISGIDLPGLLTGGGPKSGAAAAGDKTGFAQLEASFSIANGVAHNEDLRARAALISIVGAGDIDLGREQVDYNLRCTLASTGIGFPVKLSGPWSAVEWQVDSKTLSRAVIEKKAQDKLRATIKSLMKRRDSLSKPAPKAKPVR